jgi:predicted O-methyltransferase YrrM
MSFNGNPCIEEVCLALKNIYDIRTVVETGTYYGDTTHWFSKHFDIVHSIEISDTYYNDCVKRFDVLGIDNIHLYNGNSAELLPSIISNINNRCLYFLDAHWLDQWPLLDELKAIAQSKMSPVILIDDFKVPGTNLGFDSYNGNDLDINYVFDSIKKIYGENFKYFYNSVPMGNNRGICYFVPNE